MASICQPSFHTPSSDSIPHKLNLSSFRLPAQLSKRPSQSGIISPSRVAGSSLCCRGLSSSSSSSKGGESPNSSSENPWRWDFYMQEAFRNAINGFDDFLKSFRDPSAKGSVMVVDQRGREWDWERWKKHFAEVDEQEDIVLTLKSQLVNAIEKEDYEDAARIKVAIAAAATNDTVGRVMAHLKKSVEEESYGDAALMRDYAGAGLVGWWSGISKDSSNPYGRIIHIRAEYGRYVARSYGPRQLATASDGAPLFEVYFTKNEGSTYNQQAVCLKRKVASQDLYAPSFKPSGSAMMPDARDVGDIKSELFEWNYESEDTEDTEDVDDDSDFDNVLRDMIPGVNVKVVKVTAPEKADMDLMSKVNEKIIDEEEDEEDVDFETFDGEDGTKSENDDDHHDSGIDASSEISENDGETQIAVEVVIGDGFFPKLLRDTPAKELLRVPARLEHKGRLSFTFTVEETANELIASGKDQSRKNKRADLSIQRNIDKLMLDLLKGLGDGQIPKSVIKDVRRLLSQTLTPQHQSHEPLSGTTTFNRIVVSSPLDPLNGVYIGAHGIFSSEVIQMRRKFGQWKEDGSPEKLSEIEFYEYVEAVKLTGDPLIPAGQVAFRAKVGKQYQLPHKGIIPEEFGVIARYRGQGRLAGFKNPRWVDGELVVLDGKYIKEGPVVGFIYWAPEHHFVVFFNQVRLQD